MSTIGTLLFVLVAFFAVLIFAVIALFVGLGAVKLFNARKEVAKIDFTDGLDEREMQILRDAFAKRKQAADESALKAKLADIAKP